MAAYWFLDFLVNSCGPEPGYTQHHEVIQTIQAALNGKFLGPQQFGDNFEE